MKRYIKTLSGLFRYGVVYFSLICIISPKLSAQEKQTQLSAQEEQVQLSAYSVNPPDATIPHITNSPSSVALKANLLYGATLTPNLALEIGLGKKSTLEIGGGYNFYDPSSGRHWKHWLVQPEYRYWFCERFNGSFVGVHALGGEYNFAKLDLPFSVFKDLKNHRYEGYYYGGGFVFGHQWILSKRWNFEMSLGMGYVRTHYDKYECATCGRSVENGVKNYWGPTKATVLFLLFL